MNAHSNKKFIRYLPLWAACLIVNTTFLLQASLPPLEITQLIPLPANCTMAGNNAEIKIFFTGGTPPYIASATSSGGVAHFAGGVISPITIPVPPGDTYTVRLSDLSETITAPTPVLIPAPVLNIDVTSVVPLGVTCFGTATGSVQIRFKGDPSTTLLVTVGSEQQTVITDADGNGFVTFTGLAAGGPYSILFSTIGCSFTWPGTFLIANINPLFLLTSRVTNETCPHANDGTVSVTIGGGSGSYEAFLINPDDQVVGAPVFGCDGSPIVFTHVVPDIYTVKIVDTVHPNCTVTFGDFTVDVATPIVIHIPVAAVAPSCAGANDGHFTVIVTGGDQPYTVTAVPIFLSATTCPQPTETITGVASGVPAQISNLQAGNYEITAADSLNCSAKVMGIIPATAALGVTSIVVTDEICAGTDDGAITITVTGNGPFRYSLDGGSTFSAPSGSPFTFSDLAPGNYSIVVEDVRGCVTTAFPVIIAAAIPLVVGAQPFAPTCPNGNDGLIVIDATGGTGNLLYTYSGKPTPPQRSNILTGLTAGTYIISVTDERGCSISAAVTVPSAVFAITGANVTPISCNGANDAIITVTTTGGTSPLLFTLDKGTTNQVGPQNSNVFTNVGPGVHTVTVTDNNTPPCVTTFTVPAIVDPAALQVFGLAEAPLCAGDSTGKITLSATGGTPPYQFSIDGGKSFGTSRLFNNVAAGEYLVAAKDSHGCTAFRPVTVLSPSPVRFVSITKTDASCFGGNDGTITVIATGGAGDYTFSLNGGPFTAKNSFTGLIAGTYTVVAKDLNGCTVQGSVVINQPAQLMASAVVTQKALNPCTPTGQIAIIASGGTPPFAFSINNGQSFKNNGVFINLPAGNVTVVVMDSKGCIVKFNVRIPLQ